MTGSGLTVTVVGWAATTPREISGDGVPYTSFRVATTPRRFDPRAGAWTDGQTEWITVKAFRDVALNVGSSIRKGDPVVATGRLRTEEWQGESGPRMSLVLDVVALGHDLTRGRAAFTRTVNVGADAARSGTGRPPAGGPVVDDPWATTGPADAVGEDEFAEEPVAPDGDDESAGRGSEADGSALEAAGSGRAARTP
ncbi:single-stranded DNA-binding protein [Actinotalea sp. Marseille-Q4924]|uniref:single-stranded DNA-binding protein n=1 Tax=Actinotalea sp. Marseille-Q4924 TaxID=2866571 RepID=UPI001CE4749A|nr:single-stranded DNA-binding protein [Actinotalea sp. Marseille-Q4924]